MTRIPCNGKFKITCPFGKKGKLWKAGFHTGVDIVNDDRIVYSSTFGKVVNMGFDARYGNFIIIIDGDGDYHWFCHLSRITCSMGDSVTPENKIGIMGDTGNATGVHLHYEIRNKSNRYGDVQNPCDYMGIPNEVGEYNESDYADEPVYEMKTLRRSTNLRNEPTIHSSEKTLYVANTTLYILEENVSFNDGYIWDRVKIRVTGQIGYMINKNYK